MNLRQRDICGPPGMLSPHFRKEGAGVGVANLALKVGSENQRNGLVPCAKGEMSHTTVGWGRCILLCLLRTHLFLPTRKPFIWRTFLPSQHTALAANQRTPPLATWAKYNQLRTTKSLPCGLSHQNQRTTVNQGTRKARTADDHGSRPWKSHSAGEQKK